MTLEYNFSKTPPNDEVVVSYDPSIIDENYKELSPEERERKLKELKKEKKELIGSNTQSKLGLESAIGKDERMFQLKTGVDNGTIVTVASAEQALNLKRGTILKYAKELNISLLDTVAGKWTEVKED